MGCNNCPRRCSGRKYCRAPDSFKIGLYQVYLGEEPSISGEKGSGAVFFSHCNLRCVFCQNYQISQLHYGKIYSDDELIRICYQLAETGVHNINLVSPTCYHQQLIKVLKYLKRQNFPLPIVWNSNGYEDTDNIKKLEGLVDIYLPDFKYSDDKLALRYSSVSNYFEVAKRAILEMYNQHRKNRIENGIMKEGLIIRHLVLPNAIENSKMVLKWIRENIGPDVYISLMSQYTPMYKSNLFPEINRRLTWQEYDEICDYCVDLGFNNIYIQELSSATKEFVPDFVQS